MNKQVTPILPDRIRVCLVSANSYPLFNDECDAPFGGAELQVFLIAKHLAQDEKFIVSVIVGDFGQAETDHRYNVKLVKAHSRSGRATDRLFAPFKLFNAISRERPDVIIQRASGPETGICAFYARIKSVKFIYSVAHDAELAGKSVASHHPIYRHIYNYGVKKANTIVVQSEDQMRSLAQLNGKVSSDSLVISNSIEVRKPPRVKREHILWIARAQSWKRPEVFIELANEIKHESFVMIMPVEKKTAETQELIERATSLNNLQLISSVDFNLSQSYFDKAKILVNTSSWEGFPNTFLQAGIAATPIVSLEVDPDSFINEYSCGYVCNGDFSRLVNRVRHLVEITEDWQKASQNCYEYVKQKHDILKNIKQWKKLIRG